MEEKLYCLPQTFADRIYDVSADERHQLEGHQTRLQRFGQAENLQLIFGNESRLILMYTESEKEKRRCTRVKYFTYECRQFLGQVEAV